MRGLKQEEYDVLEECLGPDPDVDDPNTDPNASLETDGVLHVAERLERRGLLKRRFLDGEEWMAEVFDVTDAGRIAMTIFESMCIMGLAS